MRNARNLAIQQTARELKLVKRLAPRTNVSRVVATVEWMGKSAEMTQTLQMHRLREEVEKARSSTQTRLLQGIRRRFT